MCTTVHNWLVKSKNRVCFELHYDASLKCVCFSPCRTCYSPLICTWSQVCVSVWACLSLMNHLLKDSEGVVQWCSEQGHNQSQRVRAVRTVTPAQIAVITLTIYSHSTTGDSTRTYWLSLQERLWEKESLFRTHLIHYCDRNSQGSLFCEAALCSVKGTVYMNNLSPSLVLN